MGCRIGPDGKPWMLVCKHVANECAKGIAYPEQRDHLKYEGMLVCAPCDELTQRTGDWDEFKDYVAVCSCCCVWLATEFRYGRK